VAIAWFALSVSNISAHGVGVECKARDAKVWVTVFFDDDTDAVDAIVVVLDGEREIAKGKTNSMGIWTFPTPKPGKYQVIVDAGMGHKTKTTVTISPKAEAPKTDAPKTAEQVNDGPSREDATRFPWTRIGIGLAVVGLVAAAFLFVRTRRPN